MLSVSLAQPEPKVWKYWDTVQVARAGVASPFAGTADDAVDALEVLAKDAVRQQMMADVPLLRADGLWSRPMCRAVVTRLTQA